MKVFVTGGSGFIGSHSAIALLNAGHDVRLLARNPDKTREHFAAMGYPQVEVVKGDMRDRELVSAAMIDCDAVLHAAAMVSVEKQTDNALYESNMAGMRSVVETAVEKNIPNIVYVSSLAALFNPGAGTIDQHSPLNNATSPYAKSKRDCDEAVRSLQAQGAPVQITYPGGVIGPDDPGLSESNNALRTFVKQMVPITTSGIQLVDVRDVADAHKYLLENPPNGDPVNAKYIIGGQFYPWAEFHTLLEKITGRKISAPKIPGVVLRSIGSLLDLIQNFITLDGVLLSQESTRIVTQWVEADSRPILEQAQMTFRSGESTLKDTLRWLVKAQHLKAHYVGESILAPPGI